MSIWFGVRLLFECVVRKGDALYEDRIILVRAADERGARDSAERYGNQESHAYKNRMGEDVRWAYREILDVKQLFDAEIGDHSEVYYSFLNQREVSEVRSQLSSALGAE